MLAVLTRDERVTLYGRLRKLHAQGLRSGYGRMRVLGGNSAGETTLIRTIAGMAKATAGKVAFDGASEVGSVSGGCIESDLTGRYTRCLAATNKEGRNKGARRECPGGAWG